MVAVESTATILTTNKRESKIDNILKELPGEKTAVFVQRF